MEQTTWSLAWFWRILKRQVWTADRPSKTLSACMQEATGGNSFLQSPFPGHGSPSHWIICHMFLFFPFFTLWNILHCPPIILELRKKSVHLWLFCPLWKQQKQANNTVILYLLSHYNVNLLVNFTIQHLPGFASLWSDTSGALLNPSIVSYFFLLPTFDRKYLSLRWINYHVYSPGSDKLWYTIMC